MLRCTVLYEELKENHDSDDALMEMILTSSQRRYSIVADVLSSFNKRSVVENELVAKTEGSDRSTEPSSENTSTSSAGSVLSSSENNLIVSSFRCDNNCAADRSHNKDHSKKILKLWTCNFTTVSVKVFLRKF